MIIETPGMGTILIDKEYINSYINSKGYITIVYIIPLGKYIFKPLSKKNFQGYYIFNNYS